MPPADELFLLLLVVLIVGKKRAAVPSVRATPASPPAPATSGQQVKPGDLLTPRAHYRATIKLTGLEATFGTADAVKAKLQAAGFGDVVVMDHGGGDFEATGEWNGGATAAKFPHQVVGVWRL